MMPMLQPNAPTNSIGRKAPTPSATCPMPPICSGPDAKVSSRAHPSTIPVSSICPIMKSHPPKSARPRHKHNWQRRSASRGYRRIVMDGTNRENEDACAASCPMSKLPLIGNGGHTSPHQGASEIAIMREAARISDIGMVAAFAAARPGVSGRAIAAASAAAMLEAGAEEASLQVAVGPPTAYMGTGDWVYQPRRIIQDGDMLLVDMAIKYQGYLGDQTRTAIVGTGSAAQRELITTVQEAYRSTVAAMRPGASAPTSIASPPTSMKAKAGANTSPITFRMGSAWVATSRASPKAATILQVGDAFLVNPVSIFLALAAPALKICFAHRTWHRRVDQMPS